MNLYISNPKSLIDNFISLRDNFISFKSNYISSVSNSISFGDLDLPTPSFTPITSRQLAMFILLLAFYFVSKYLISKIVYVYSISYSDKPHRIGTTFSFSSSYGKCIFVPKRIIQKGETSHYLLIQKEGFSKAFPDEKIIIISEKKFYSYKNKRKIYAKL